MSKLIGLTSDLHYGFEGLVTHSILEEFYKGLKRDEIDILIIAGDIISHEQRQWYDAFKLIRKYFPEIPVCIVFGNHDYWGIKKDFNRGVQKIHEVLNKFDIVYLPNNPYQTDSLIIRGIGGWYGSSHPPSNDEHYMPRQFGDIPLHDMMYGRESYILENIPKKDDTRTHICVTHFEPSDSPMGGPNWLDRFNEVCDILIVGHSHAPSDRLKLDMRVMNPGSDYNRPRYKLLECD